MIVNLIILVSGRGSNFEVIINAIKRKYITNAQIKLVISNNSNSLRQLALAMPSIIAQE